jgi:hypothetical protein
MTVYIVWHKNFNYEDEFIGVFSSEEKAQERIERFSKSDRCDFHIETEELDDY